jgi:hypothetical protein
MLRKENTKSLYFDVNVVAESDVLVVGGGPAGIAAAIAAARQNAKTILIEQTGCVGGMGTSGLVGPFMSNYDTVGKEEIVKGIFRELINRMIARGGALDPSTMKASTEYVSFITLCHHNSTPFDPELLKFVAEEMLMENGVEIRYFTRLVKARVDENNAIDSIVVADKRGLSILKSSLYIDCTGDGDLAAFSGQSYIQDAEVQPATLFMRIGGVDDEKVREWVARNMPPEKRLFASIVKQAKLDGDFPADCQRESVGMYRQIRPGEWSINTARILGVDGTNPESITDGMIKGRKQLWGLLEFFRKCCPGLENAYMIDSAGSLGVRETRRIKCKYTLTKDDVIGAVPFDDTIARYAFFLDIHNPRGGYQETKEILTIKNGTSFEIPYRCLIPSDRTNLLIAGRCIGADHQAHGATRIMPACYATGQAAGTAAGLALQQKVDVGDLDVKLLQKELKRGNCVIS